MAEMDLPPTVTEASRTRWMMARTGTNLKTPEASFSGSEAGFPKNRIAASVSDLRGDTRAEAAKIHLSAYRRCLGYVQIIHAPAKGFLITGKSCDLILESRGDTGHCCETRQAHSERFQSRPLIINSFKVNWL
jgi:hypothetical protein